MIKSIKGFTLAEVLITLGIIGVVAALVMPNLVANLQRQYFKAKLKKSYSILLNALLEMERDSGQRVSPTDYNSVKFIYSFKNYFKLAKDCGMRECVPQTGCNYKTYNKHSEISCGLLDDGQFILLDGSMILLENPSGVSKVLISVDVNGYKNLPNILGVDLFTFQLMSDGRLLPMGAEGTSHDETSYCSKTSTSDVNGIACTNRALYDDDFLK